MVSAKIWMIINVALVLLAVVLIMSLFGLQLPGLGQASYYFDKEEPLCVVSFQGRQSVLPDLGQCCRQLQQQLYCDTMQEEVEIAGTLQEVDTKCYTSESTPAYMVNKKAYNYCHKEGLI